MDNPLKKDVPDADAEAAAKRVRELNERIIATSRKAGLMSLDLYEKTLKSIADMQQEVGKASQVQWFSAIAEAQASFTREMAETYTTAARELLKP
ncbi:MAG: hypothetical protein M3N47_14635 [Chloroflexota bacterium]|nr:hypothetical protein [Chloroflexota bacterium]